MPNDSDYRGLSLWLGSIDGSLKRRPALPGDRTADVAIVGAGFTGLWTAYYLVRLDPGIRIVLVDKEIAGFGASGRNGGWCSDLFPASWDKIARNAGRPAALAMKQAMRASIDAVGEAIGTENIDCGWARGGTIGFARSPLQLERAQAEIANATAWGDSDEDIRLLSADEVQDVAGVAGALGATFTPHCAAINPGELVRSLAQTVVARGVQLYEGTAVGRILPHRVVTEFGDISAEVVIRATEAYTPSFRGHRRDVAPVYSLIVATEPLDSETLDAVGLGSRPTFTDHRHMICYGQRTADGRIVFGGRGAPYHFGSRTHSDFDQNSRVFDSLKLDLIEMFPALSKARFSHCWGGPLGIPRDWHASVGLDEQTGFGWAGGYVGDGMSTSNLAGRTLADLICKRRTEITDLPWVGHRSRKWEPEPLRFLGVNAGLRAMSAADQSERRTGRSSSTARAFGRLLGG